MNNLLPVAKDSRGAREHHEAATLPIGGTWEPSAASPRFAASLESIVDNAMAPPAFFHIPSGTVRFWVLIDGVAVGATIGKATLRYRYRAFATEDDPLTTYIANSTEIDAAVRRRVAGGSIEPVMLQDNDVRPLVSGQSTGGSR